MKEMHFTVVIILSFGVILCSAQTSEHSVQETVNVTDEVDIEAFVEAAENGNVTIVEQFIKNGGNVNQLNIRGSSALHEAIIEDQPKIVELLIQNNADVNLLDIQHRTPLQINAKFGNENITKMLLDNGARDKNYALTEAASYGHEKIVELLLKEGADVNAAGYNGQRAIHGAAGNVKILDLLLKNGADINVVDNDGESVLHEATQVYACGEQRTYILSVAVAAPEGIAYFAYDINIINENCDYVNIMTYDYHFYSKSSPFTGLNAPLYRRHDEHSVFATLNINSSVSYWQSNGLDKSKIVVGLPTYGHSFRLVNALNTKLGAPASDVGRVGQAGFVTYADVCWFDRNNYFITKVFDVETCSPYMYAGTEWISYEDERSITCKTNYVKHNDFGGVMIFSLNTDDYSSYCDYGDDIDHSQFPLTRKISSILFK